MTENQTVGKALAKKILVVQKAVTNIPKRGKNTFHKYDYVLAADAVDHVRQACNTADLVVTPVRISKIEEVRQLQTSQGGVQYVTRVTIAYQIMDPDSGESMVVEWQGEGADGQDKGLNKAYTVCFKYFIMQFFMVAGGDMDPENPAYEQPPDKPQRRRPGKAQQPAAGKGTASEAKIKYITDLMASEWIPGSIRTAIAAWLQKHKEKQSWPDDQATRSIDQLKKFWPVQKGKGVVTKKQLEFLEKLVKSESIPKGLRDKSNEQIANHHSQADFDITKAQASAMIECCQWYITEGEKKKAQAAVTPEQKATEKADQDAFDKIQDLLEQIDAEYPKHQAPGGEMQEQAFQSWRDQSTWSVDECMAWLADIKDWPVKGGE